VPPDQSPVANFAFDVTPARLVTAFITERGVCKPEKEDILRLFPEKRQIP
jgi:methylthioribose-1-phosphate isomerase